MDFERLEKLTGYSVYTRKHDEIVHVRDLADEEVRKECGADLEQPRTNGGEIQEAVAELAATLAKMSPEEAEDTTVTFLVDNSGSMRGRNIEETAVAVLAMTKSLEGAGIATEVLGYTTRSWKGGEARQEWLHDGRHINPGRLCELRHIVYKEAAEPMSSAADGIAAMTINGLHKENIDNEALIWGYGRLACRSQGRKLLVLLTDGIMPICDASLSVNPDLFRDHHKAVVKAIESSKEVDFIAVGIDLHKSWNEQKDEFYSDISTSGPVASEIIHACAAGLAKHLDTSPENSSPIP